ncbi:MAG: hypothetical protein P8P49_07725 [Opitutales bacterium]|nr:hypothetical protein [Opitutales bacterium]
MSIKGVNFDGAAEFTFSLIDKKGSTHWRNGLKKDKTIQVIARTGHGPRRIAAISVAT